MKVNIRSFVNRGSFVPDAVVVDTVDKLTSDLKSSSNTVIVKDINRGGTFIYDSTKSNINDGGIVFNGWVRQFSGPLNILWFGAKGDGIADDTDAIQKPIDLIRDRIFHEDPLKSPVVYLPSGTYRITDSIGLKQTVSLEGEGARYGTSGGTEIICDFDDFTPPTDIYNNANGDHYDVILDKKPMLYNDMHLLNFNKISRIRLNGNNKDVYGLFFNEIYYFGIDNLSVTNCNNSPFTLVYSQFNNIKQLSCTGNGAPVRILCCSTTTIDGLDIETSFTKGSILDIVHSISTKAGVLVNNFHYEDTGTATPPGDFIKIAQRGAGIRDMFATFVDGGSDRYIHLLDDGSDYYFDGVTIKTVSNDQVQLVNIGGVRVKLGKGSKSCNIESLSPIMSETDNISNRIMNSVMRSFSVITASLKKMLWFSDDNTINFFDNSNRRIKSVYADMYIENSNGRIVLRSGFNVGTSTVQTHSKMLDIRKKDGSTGDFSEGLIRLSGHYLWVDSSGKLRIKQTLPDSDTDGIVVGS